jgi:hypothetical protein
MTTLPPSPFLSSAIPAETLPTVVPGNPDHDPVGSNEIPIDYEAFFDAIAPPDPPPVFLRKPSQAFMRALFELSR